MSESLKRGAFIRQIWEGKILREWVPVLQLQNVYRGESVFVDYKSNIDPAIGMHYSTPSGEPLVHRSTVSVLPPYRLEPQSYTSWFLLRRVKSVRMCILASKPFKSSLTHQQESCAAFWCRLYPVFTQSLTSKELAGVNNWLNSEWSRHHPG